MASTKTASAPVKRSARVIAGDTPATDPARIKALEQYEVAVRLLQEGKYEKAHTAFEKLLTNTPSDFADRIRMYINTCLKQSTKTKTQFNSPEEQYDFAISLLNDGQYEDAREQLHQIVKGNSSADYAFYGLAILASMTGDSHKCLEHLTEAIRLNSMNRIQARADSDFQDMSDDPRFTELLYPEA